MLTMRGEAEKDFLQQSGLWPWEKDCRTLAADHRLERRTRRYLTRVAGPPAPSQNNGVTAHTPLTVSKDALEVNPQWAYG